MHEDSTEVGPGAERGLVILPYGGMTDDQAAAVFAVRHAVFVVEQGITAVPDRDGLDTGAEHVLVSDGGRVVGTARLLAIEASGRPAIKVGRAAVLAEYRGRGIGRAIMLAINDHLAGRGIEGVMSAQAYLAGWYASLGWRREGESYLEAGIEHCKMRYTPGDRA